MKYDDAVRAAEQLIVDYNAATGIPKGNAGHIDVATFKDNLKAKVGATTDNTLSLVRECDLVTLLMLPPVLSRQIVRLFTQGRPSDVDPTKDSELCSLEDLVRKYDDKRPKDAYGKRLDYEVGQRRVLVYDTDGNLDVSLTIAEARRLVEDKVAERSEFTKGGKIYTVHRVGEGSARIMQQHPLYANEFLASDGTSARGISWGPIDETGPAPRGKDWVAFLQVINLAALDTKECVTEPRSERELALFREFDALEKKRAGDAFTEACMRYTKAGARFHQLRKAGALSILRTASGQ